MKAITIRWTNRCCLNDSVSAFPAKNWHGLYCISKERGATPEKPVYIGISNAEYNTISNRLKDHKKTKLPPTQGLYFVRFGQIKNQLPFNDYKNDLEIAESAFISYLIKGGYNLINRQTKRKIAQECPIYIYNVGDKFFLPPRLSSNVQL